MRKSAKRSHFIVPFAKNFISSENVESCLPSPVFSTAQLHVVQKTPSNLQSDKCKRTVKDILSLISSEENEEGSNFSNDFPSKKKPSEISSYSSPPNETLNFSHIAQNNNLSVDISFTEELQGDSNLQQKHRPLTICEVDKSGCKEHNDLISVHKVQESLSSFSDNESSAKEQESDDFVSAYQKKYSPISFHNSDGSAIKRCISNINSFQTENTALPLHESVTDVTENNNSCSTSELTGDAETSLSAEEILKMNSYGKEVQLSEQASYFNVLWCKRSTKKHKKWEGDAILIVQSRSAILKDLEGKELARCVGYKIKEIASIEEGSTFFVGGKECEIQSQIPRDDYLKGRCFQAQQAVPVIPAPLSICAKFHSPLNRNEIGKKRKFKPQLKILTPSESSDVNALCMPRPNLQHQWQHNKLNLPVADVKVDCHICKHLRPHQRDGVVFLYECIMGFKDFNGQGAILGDQMGLGKTLQCIALIWTLYKHGPYGNKPVLKKALIITPSSLVKNWQAEFYKWLGKERIAVFAVSPDRKVKEFIHSNHTVLIISYEMYVRNAEILKSVKFDLVICDEGHRLKNINVKTSGVIMNLPTKRRILLTGTPIQNDLEEFYSIIEFVNPGILGSKLEFKKVYIEPIMTSRNSKCTEQENILGSERASSLAEITGMFFLRRTQEVINKYLPPKYEVVVFCRPTDLQCKLYEQLLQSREVRSFLSSNGFCSGSPHLQCISVLRKLCNHPSLLCVKSTQSSDDDAEVYDGDILDRMQSAFPEGYVHSPDHSGKLKVTQNIVHSLFDSGAREKIVLVSNFTQTLNIFEGLCKSCGYLYLRLDGSTNTSARLNIVENFNSPFSKERILLLSSKAGGVGLNLIGASRILLYDIDWNPATDLQAMARIWRDGQKRPVYVYRLLTTGSIEEKIYQRQVTKQGLSGTIIDTNVGVSSQFSNEELKDLFTFHSDTSCLTHDSIQCACLDSEDESVAEEVEDKENMKSDHLGWSKTTYQTKNTSMAELLKWSHFQGPISEDGFPDSFLESCGEDVTFLFLNKVNFDSKKT